MSVDTLKELILYIDDEQENLDGFKFSFSRNYKIFTALNFTDAINIINHNSIKVVISDQKLPEGSGTEFFEKLSISNPHIIRIIITAFADIDVIMSAVNKGQVYRFLTKPWDKNDLKITIDTAIDVYNLKDKNIELLNELTKSNTELTELNKKLLSEINIRKAVQEELAKHRDNLEILVRERTAEVDMVNEELTATNEKLINKNNELYAINEELEIMNVTLDKEVENRKQIQNNLEESESKFRGFIEQSTDGAYFVDNQGHIVEWNNKMEQIFGITKVEMLNNSILEFEYNIMPDNEKTPELYTRIKNEITTYIQNIDDAKIYPLEGFRQTSEGNQVYISSVVFPIITPKGKYIGRIFRDLTEQKKVEEELSKYREQLEVLVKERTQQLFETENKLQILSDNLPGGAIYSGYNDDNGITHLVYGSAKIEEISHIPIDSLKKDMGLFFSKIHNEDKREFERQRIECQKSLQLLDIEIRFWRTPRDLIWVHLRVMYKIGNDGRIWWDGYVIDITRRKLAEKAAWERENVIKSIHEGIAAKTGEKLFETVVAQLSGTLNANYVLIGELNKQLDAIKTLSFIANNKIQENIEYNIKGTPTEIILKKNTFSITSNIAQFFPKDKILLNRKIEGYVGVTLYGAQNQPVGIMAALFNNEIDDVKYVEQILQIFSSRVGAELERIKAESALKERETRFRTLFDISPNIMLIARPNANIVEANTAFYHATGYDRNSLQNISISSILWEPGYYLQIMDEYFKKGRVSNFEAIFKDNMGGAHNMLISVEPVLINDENCQLFTATDITRRKAAEQAIQEFSDIVRNMQIGLLVFHAENNNDPSSIHLTNANQAAAQIIGIPYNTIFEKPGSEIFRKLKNLIFQKAIFDVLKTGRPYQDDELPFPINEYVTLFFSLKIFNIPNNRVGVLFEDITERKMIEQALKENEQKLLNIFNSSSDAILISDYDYRIIEVNEPLTKMFGYSDYDIINIPSYELCLPVYADIIKERIQLLRNNDKIIGLELEVMSKNGKIVPVELNCRSIVHNGRPAILSFIRDITERKQIEKKLFDTIIRTEEKEREKFAGNLHDEVGPLLSSLKMYFSLLIETEKKEKKDYIVPQIQTLIKEAITSVREISNDLSPHVLNTYGCITAVNSFLSLKRDLIPIDFTQNIDNKRFNSNIEVMVYRIVKELVNNTIKHASATSITIKILEEDNYIKVWYTDNGKGFDLEKTMDEKKGGIGLLNILSRIKTIDGKYKLNTQKGKGFRFELVVPL
jgi:PAS domain S-box-containing protein